MKCKIPQLKIIKSVIIFFVIIFVGLYLYVNNPRTSTLKINEVSYENDLGYDWVEIYNPSLQTMSLKGLFLTDDKLALEKYEIEEDILIEPNGYVVIYSDKYDGETENGVKLNFDISNGETVYLIAKRSLAIIDSLTILNEEDDESRVSIGRFPDGLENTFVLTTPSMGIANVKDHIPGLKEKPYGN